MVFTVNFLQKFIKQLEEFDKASEKCELKAEETLKDIISGQSKEASNMLDTQQRKIKPSYNSKNSLFETYKSNLQELARKEKSRENDLYDKITQCKSVLTMIDFKVKSFAERNPAYDISGNSYSKAGIGGIILEHLFQNKGEISNIISSFTETELSNAKGKKISKGFLEKCARLYNYSSGVQSLLKEKIESLRTELFANKEKIMHERNKLWTKYQNECDHILLARNAKRQDNDKYRSLEGKKQIVALEKRQTELSSTKFEDIKQRKAKFSSDFDHEGAYYEYIKIYEEEPFIENYRCTDKIPDSIRIATLVYDLSTSNLGKHAKALLEEYYPALYRHGKLHVPFCLRLDRGFNYMFEFNAGSKEMLANKACSMAMRLFMMIKPNRVNFTFIDPMDKGSTFAYFGNLVEDNDPVKKVLNGGIKTSAADIDDRLHFLTNHISRITQRCLQGRYENIQQYNEDAEQNAEPYEILMIADFPYSFSEKSLRMLQEIISTGTKCGVYSIILKSDEQIAAVADTKMLPLISSIEEQNMLLDARGKQILLKNGSNRKFTFFINPLLPDGSLAEETALFSSDDPIKEMDSIMQELKAGFKNADKITVTFEESIIRQETPREKWFKGDSTKNVVIPIGTRGAGKIQSLEFGEEFGSFHALIAGRTGSGKSSLLHTLIMSALIKYSANDLQIFLIDFKSGVEFKIFTHFKLDVIRAIAIESEREFGGSVLDFLSREMNDRAEKFKRLGVDKIEDYRQKVSGESSVMPRIILIFDEFHFLFSKETDALSQKAAKHIEQIAKQGRSFGVHLILSTQSLAGVGGISQDVWGQIGVRIAFKCSKDDARLVLNEGSEDIEALSQDNPGQAIYNSDCGNKIANTLFRVSYIDQKEQEQEKLLGEISERTAEKEKTGAETRILLSNVEENIHHPFKKFGDGGKPDNFKKNTVLIGESLQLFGELRTDFRDRKKSNMLIIGNDIQKARAMFTFSSLSLILHTMAKANWKKPFCDCIHIMDFAPPEENGYDALVTLKDKTPGLVTYDEFDDSIGALEKLYKELPSRKKEDKSHYLFLFGLQRARTLRQSSASITEQTHVTTGIHDDSWLDENEAKPTATPYQMLLDILKEGPEKNIHVIIWIDNFKTFQTHYPGWLDSFFDLRVAFTMPDEDSVLFMEEPDGSQISENNAVFSYNGNQKFRPYRMPDPDWFKKICGRISEIEQEENNV